MRQPILHLHKYHFGLLWDDLHNAIGTFPATQEVFIGYGISPIGEPFPLTPFHIFGDRSGFFLGDTGQQCDEKFAFAVHGVDGVAGETGYGLGDDEVNVSG